MNPSTRIQRTNRREHATGPTLGTVVLHAAAALLTLVGLLKRRRGTPKPPARPARESAVQNDLYAEWLMMEHAVATGKTSREDADRYWNRRSA